MAAAHVSGVAALVLASGMIDRGTKASSVQAQVATRLKKTARSIGISPLLQGAGLIDAARATEPRVPDGLLRARRRPASERARAQVVRTMITLQGA